VSSAENKSKGSPHEFDQPVGLDLLLLPVQIINDDVHFFSVHLFFIDFKKLFHVSLIHAVLDEQRKELSCF
jgi:hypothetical protein